MRLLSSLAVAAALEAILPGFEAAHGITTDAVLLPTSLLLARIRAGERGDVAVLTAAGIEALTAEGVLLPGSVRALAWSTVGIAVRSGAARPPIGTEAELVETLRAARSIGLSRAGASGLYFDGLLRRLGLFEAVHAKAVVIESGYTAALVASGQVELAVQQVSELLMVAGVDVVGPLPAGLGAESLFSGGVFEGAAAAEAAAGLLAAIAEARDILRRTGLAPA